MGKMEVEENVAYGASRGSEADKQADWRKLGISHRSVLHKIKSQHGKDAVSFSNSLNSALVYSFIIQFLVQLKMGLSPT